MDDTFKLQLFSERVEELSKCRLVREGFDVGLTMRWSKETEVADYKFKQPDEELFRALLLSLRLFFLEKEPTYIYRIYNICQRRITNETHRLYLAKSRQFLSEALQSSGTHLIMNTQHLPPHKVWDIYVNGFYFHSDEKKYKFIAEVPDHMRNILKMELYSFVQSSIRQICYTGNIVAYSLKNHEIL
jgi:hypothetical protein